ncbi:MAG: D-glycerate dehydrogenase [Chloroflexota bacterium]|nr:D-glycerate dehydrogenase [Chloroflexota bacterium]
MKVFVTYKLPEAGMKNLRGKFDLILYEEERLPSKEDLLRNVPDADALLCVATVIDRDIMDAGRKLRVVANYGVGYNNIDVDYATRKGLMVTNTPGVLTETTADLAWAILMAVARRLVEGDRLLRAGDPRVWKLNGMLGSDVQGKVLGIVGFGRIGKAVARRALGFGMKVLYYSRHRVASEVEQAYNATYIDLDTLLKQADFVSLHVPLDDSTRHLIDAAKLSLMKPTAFLINTSRGAVIDEQALAQALKQRRIAGAALDVYEREPELSRGLAEQDNVVLIPHLGSATKQTRDAMAELAAENVIAVLSGQVPPSLVNKQVLKTM